MRRSPRPTDGNLAAVLSMLGDGDHAELEAALQICFRVGPPIIEFLVAEANKATTTPVHVFRLLDVAERIGGERGPGEDRHLRALMQHRSLEIRKKAQNLFDVLSPKRTRKPSTRMLVRSGGVEMAMVAAARRSFRTRTSTKGRSQSKLTPARIP